MRRRLTAVAAVALPVLLACTSGPAVTAQAPVASTPGKESTTSSAAAGLRDIRIKWSRVDGGFSSPTEVTSARDGARRLFVVEKGGRIKVVRGGRTLKQKYVSIPKKVATAGEGGLLSVAFSPTFKSDHLLWIAYARQNGGDLVVARMRAGSARASHVRNKTLRTLLVVEHSANDNHYGGQLAFGPDGMLYIGTGDGGGGGDPLNSAGDKRDLRGKILRINPMGSCGGRLYCIPNDNPFVGKVGKDQIWLLGLRNPWRFSFDRPSGALWIGDVGQDAYEEINRVPESPARINLGWSCREGRALYNPSRCRPGVDYMPPVTTVAHPAGESITGGFVYRGDDFRRRIGGAYIFADFVTRRVWLYSEGQGKLLQPQRLGPYDYAGPTSFGVDDNGEILAVTYDGTLWRMRATRR
jgi:glucose/arabinose dehydrogenase